MIGVFSIMKLKKVVSLLLVLTLVMSVFVLTSCEKENVLTVYTNAEFPPFEYL